MEVSGKRWDSRMAMQSASLRRRMTDRRRHRSGALESVQTPQTSASGSGRSKKSRGHPITMEEAAEEAKSRLRHSCAARLSPAWMSLDRRPSGARNALPVQIPDRPEGGSIFSFLHKSGIATNPANPQKECLSGFFPSYPLCPDHRCSRNSRFGTGTSLQVSSWKFSSRIEP